VKTRSSISTRKARPKIAKISYAQTVAVNLSHTAKNAARNLKNLSRAATAKSLSRAQQNKKEGAAENKKKRNAAQKRKRRKRKQVTSLSLSHTKQTVQLLSLSLHSKTSNKS
jgi:hypothetical protein